MAGRSLPSCRIGNIFGRQCQRQGLALGGIILLGGLGCRIAGLMHGFTGGKPGIEAIDHGATKATLIRGLKLKQAHHVSAPMLVIAAIADDAHRVGLAEDFRQRNHIAKIVLTSRNGLAMHAQSWQESHDSQTRHPEGSLKHLLLHADTFARIEPALKPFADRISPLVLTDQADVQHPWGESEADGVLSFGTQDAFFSPAAREYFKMVLSFENLDWFQSSAAGTEHPMLQAIGKNARQYTACHAQSDAIAEWVLWAGFDYFQKGAARRQAQADAAWTRIAFRELSSTHWLVLGFGGIGQAVGQRLKALGAEVTAVRRSGGASPHADRIITMEDLPAWLGKADAVLLCLPHTPETENVADTAFFASMKPDSLFLNVGRGALVDEAALLAGLDAGHPAHAALDVLRVEPQPEDGPFWARDDVTLTAHISAATHGSLLRTDAIFLENLERYLAGKPLEYLINPDTFA